MEYWQGNVFLSQDYGLYLGHAADTSWHATHAIKIAISWTGQFRIATQDNNWHYTQAAMIAADTNHRLDGSGNQLALFYLVPETSLARNITGEYLQKEIIDLPQATVRSLQGELHNISSQINSQISNQSCNGEIMQWLYEMLSQSLIAQPQDQILDDRIDEILQYLNTMEASPEELLRIEQLAAHVSLSPSRLSHLFAEQIGLPLRRYLLWWRLRSALDEMVNCDSITSVAHKVGFADAAHLSRTFRQMLGLSPSELFKKSQFITSES